MGHVKTDYQWKKMFKCCLFVIKQLVRYIRQVHLHVCYKIYSGFTEFHSTMRKVVSNLARAQFQNFVRSLGNYTGFT